MDLYRMGRRLVGGGAALTALVILVPSSADVLLTVLRISVLILFGLVPFIVAVDVWALPRDHGQRMGSIDVLWALAVILLAPMGTLAWLVFGRRIRKRELRERMSQPSLSQPL